MPPLRRHPKADGCTWADLTAVIGKAEALRRFGEIPTIGGLESGQLTVSLQPTGLDTLRDKARFLHRNGRNGISEASLRKVHDHGPPSKKKRKRKRNSKKASTKKAWWRTQKKLRPPSVG
jgi:hypothetical protein